MKKLAMHARYALIPVALAGCTMGENDAAGPGGNVGFGGAQDIGQFRDILESGDIPGPGTLDANGFFAEHYVPLPPAECGQDLCLHSMLAVAPSWLDGSLQATLAVAMSTPVDPASLERKPRDLVVVVDTSGSMNVDDRIGFARYGLHLLVDALDDDDRMALVTYSNSAFVEYPFDDLPEDVPGDEPGDGSGGEPGDEPQGVLDRAALHEAIDRLAAMGGTNIYDGLSTALELAVATQDPARQSRVILLSDGLATEGITDDEGIIAMAEEYIGSGSGTGLTTIGVGSSFNVALMRGLAERGAGNFYFLEDAVAVQEVFTEELDYFATPLALSVTVELRPGPGYLPGEVTGTRLWRSEDGVGSIHLPAVFLASRTSDQPGEYGRRGGGGTLFIPMIPTGNPGEDANRVAEVRMRYRVPGTDEYREQVIEVRIPDEPEITPEWSYYSDQTLPKQMAMYNIYQGLLQAATMADWGNYGCALATLEDLDARAASWDAEDADIAADRALMEMFMANLRASGATRPAEGWVCAGDGYYPPEYGYDDDYEVRACQAVPGQGPGSALLWLAAVGGLMIRRRRQHA